MTNCEAEDAPPDHHKIERTNDRSARPGGAHGTESRVDPQIVILPTPQNDDPQEANRILAQHLPGWATLERGEQLEAAKLLIAHRRRNRPVTIKLVPKPDGKFSVEPAGKCEAISTLKLLDAFSANSIDPVNSRASELMAYLESVGACTEGQYNAALSFVESMNPRDQAEALLLVQMYVTHDAAIRALSRIGAAEWTPQMQTFGNLASKLLRASQGQMETLARMRRGGEQVVRHIHVDNRGGQAVIADKIVTGGSNVESGIQPHEQRSCGPAMLGSDPVRNGVPIACDGEQEAMPTTRRNVPRRAKG